MKNFFNLFLLNLKDMWKNHKFVFIIVNLFMFFSFSFFLLSYDKCSYEASNSDDYTYFGDTFIYEINSLDNIESKLDKFIKKTKNIRCIFFSFRNNADDTVSKNFTERQKNREFNEEIYVLYYGDLVNYVPYKKGRWFFDSEKENGSKVVLAPCASFLNRIYGSEEAVDHEIGSEYSINGENYMVIGQSSIIEHAFVIPYNSLTDKSVITNIHISVMEKYTEIGNKIFDNKVKKYFDVELNKESTPRSLEIEAYIIIAYFIMFNVTMINLAYIYSYLLSQRKTLIGLFNVYGMDKNTRVRYLLLEYLIWLLANYVLSMIFSSIFIVIEKYLLKESFRFLSIAEYLMFLMIYVILYFICLSPVINRTVDVYGKFQEFTMEDDK